ncbi:hypothetical protein PUMCH_002459 [Australozyma saopauloensis]|uniref:Rhodanese domain-containing protein n=1 Tax=Australozyma saopauloensis TaxID=291208 RepID=A0AAX4H9P7_9ASCO|nr:hypothetical protein PUMCH_002459 [[Candida] saopauloensis]
MNDSEELVALRLKVAQLEEENNALKLKLGQSPIVPSEKILDSLSLEEYRRYGRQMIVPEFGSLPSQLKLRQAKILVVGAGGLGCPALLYLAAAGVGKIGILDNDTVDESNLHRQVLHRTTSVGILKCESAKSYLNELNPNVEIVTHPVRLENSNAFNIIEGYDLVVDCTDTPATRYLINDASVLAGKTIVSGSGVKTHGQVTILNFKNEGPCYRCFYPTPPKPESVSTCGDSGVFGPAIGLTGIMLATEAIKVLTNYYDDNFLPFLLQYSAFPQHSIRSFRMRGRKQECAVCGLNPTISKGDILSGTINYLSFCGKISYNVVSEDERLSPEEARQLLAQDPKTIILDVRPEEQFKITRLPNAVNSGWERTLSRADSLENILPNEFSPELDNILVMCRYGNDSRYALRKLKDQFGLKKVYDLIGGIDRWSSEIDPSIPRY